MSVFKISEVGSAKTEREQRKIKRRLRRKASKTDPHKLFHSASVEPVKGEKGMYYVVYIIRHTSGAFYIGSHQSKTPDPILNTYFTSSKVIANVIAVDGVESFTVEYCMHFKNRYAANLVESMLIEMNDPSYNDAILNKAYVERGVDTIVKDWPVIQYKGKDVKINPVCILLNESSSHKPRIVLPELDTRPKRERMNYDPATDPNRKPKPTGKVYRVKSDGTRVECV